MKGGITSGVVYPKAIALLSKHYRFKNIGGTSVGAIAAAVTAAAEYHRRTTGSHQGFEILAGLPEELQTAPPGSGRSKLFSLFQPQPATRRLFSVLISSLNREGTFRRILAILSGVLRAYWPATLVSIAVAAVVGLFGPGWFTAFLVLVILLVVTIGAWIYLDVTRNVVKNGFGLCTGLTEEANHEALTPWLHALIQKAAGLGADDPPLTFGKLWKAPGFPPDWLKLPRDTPFRSIDLQMFSTNLAHGRPYIFPLQVPDEGSTRFRDRDRLFFNPDELGRYLPGEVLKWMKTYGKPYQLEEKRKGRDPDEGEAIELGLLELPNPEDFPVLLAARMSLSFPFLFAAVPLWAINYDAPPGKRHFHRCWFSDGGISSNFPIHLFDGLVPLWPTFGIDLEPKIEGREMVFLPKEYTEGYGERWNLFADQKNSASRFGGFLSAIIATMQSWNDNALARMPGVRDRTARVRLDGHEGGLNLNMEAPVVQNIATRGEKAAAELISRFVAQPPDGPQPEGWDEQRFVRLGVLLKMLEERAPGILNVLYSDCPHATDIKTLIDNAAQSNGSDGTQKPPAGYENPLTPEQVQALHEVLEALKRLMDTLGDPNRKSGFKPIPKPELRVRPPL
ncbi:hypothetical protein [Methylocaldum sp.]|uniref:hypothetical protein n=1 Tax=Methylocaldum sp. TaxID=1969727 RepID=UPI002D78E885|nr:hypothetical protein [Methylocaldum sp.]